MFNVNAPGQNTGHKGSSQGIPFFLGEQILLPTGQHVKVVVSYTVLNLLVLCSGKINSSKGFTIGTKGSSSYPFLLPLRLEENCVTAKRWYFVKNSVQRALIAQQHLHQ